MWERPTRRRLSLLGVHESDRNLSADLGTGGKSSPARDLRSDRQGAIWRGSLLG